MSSLYNWSPACCLIAAGVTNLIGGKKGLISIVHTHARFSQFLGNDSVRNMMGAGQG